MKVVYPRDIFREKFSSNDQCLKYLYDMRFGDSYTCPKCGKQKFHRVKNHKSFSCSCGYQVYPMKGTVLTGSPVDLWKWFELLYEMHDSERGVSLYKIGARLEVDYRTIWRMGMLIRGLMFDDDILLDGEVEVDCTYIGGYNKPKTILFGMIEKRPAGRARMYVIDKESREIVLPYILKHIKPGSTICTDQHGAYYDLKLDGYKHKVVNHSRRQYVDKADKTNHTCNIDSYWSRLKRSFLSTHGFVSPKYMQYYVNEFAFRHNRRDDKAKIFTDILDRLTSTDPRDWELWQQVKLLKPEPSNDE